MNTLSFSVYHIFSEICVGNDFLFDYEIKFWGLPHFLMIKTKIYMTIYLGVLCTPKGSDSYECEPCPAGLLGDGESCVPPGLCNPNPCYPGNSRGSCLAFSTFL